MIGGGAEASQLVMAVLLFLQAWRFCVSTYQMGHWMIFEQLYSIIPSPAPHNLVKHDP